MTTCIRKIAFFGASVTQQKESYAKQLSHLATSIKIFGFGGMHIKNAGICFIDDVILYKPTICFIDWFSTAYLDCSQVTIEYINSILYKLEQIQCKPVFLFIPHKNHENRKQFYGFCKNHLHAIGASYIDLAENISYSEEIMRDSVHTTAIGSKLYADFIEKNFLQILNNIQIPHINYKPRYIDIKHKQFPIKIYNKITFEGEFELIGLLGTVGPYSGIVEIYDTACNSTTSINTWDRWCHYIRDHFYLNYNVSQKIIIKVSNEKFDTTSCKDATLNFETQNKFLDIKKIFYVGKLNSVKPSIRDNFLNFARNIYSRLKKIKK